MQAFTPVICKTGSLGFDAALVIHKSLDFGTMMAIIAYSIGIVMFKVSMQLILDDMFFYYILGTKSEWARSVYEPHLTSFQNPR